MNNQQWPSVTSIDQDLDDWLLSQMQNQPVGFIHSVFEHVLNFISLDQRRMFSIGGSDVIRSPYMMVMGESVDFHNMNPCLQPSIPIFLKGNTLLLDHICQIDFAPAERWKRTVTSLYHTDIRSFFLALQQLSYSIRMKGNKGGLQTAWQLFNHHYPDGTSTIHERVLAKRLLELADAIEENNVKDIYLISKQFVGLGVGLTPSGDDFLTGWLLTLQALQHPIMNIFFQHQDDWLNHAKHNTTNVSYFMLEAAFYGKGNEAILDVIEGIEDVGISLSSAVERLLTIGSCSGTDMLTGVAFALAKSAYA
jgi:hypothetical protein